MDGQARKRTVLWCIAAALPLLLARAALPGLADPSEARYGQICREMAEAGDWLVPRWKGIPHLEKPPLVYWTGAAGIRLLGRTELAVRLGSLLMLVASAVWAAGIARRVAGPEASAPAALGMLLSPLTVAAGAACHTDPFLLAATTLFFHSVVRRLHDGSQRALDAAALALAFGILAKGHMVLLFTVAPLALARSGIFRELWRLRRVALILALTVPWFAMIEVRFPGFFRHQFLALGGRAMGSGHRAPFFIYAFALAAGLMPFALYAPRGYAALGPPYRRMLLLWLVVPLVVLSAAKSRLWTYILPATPPLLIFAAARLGPIRAAGARWLKWGFATAGAALLVVSAISGSGAAVLPFLAHVGVAMLLCGVWLLVAARFRLWVAVAGVSAIVVATFVEGATTQEDLFQIHRRFAREVRDLAAKTGAPVVVAGMSLPSIGFYCDTPVTIAGESGRLAREAEVWGESPLFTPGTDVGKLLGSDFRSVIVVKEKVRASLAPGRRPLLEADDVVAVQGPP